LHLERNAHVHMAAFWLQGRHSGFVVDINREHAAAVEIVRHLGIQVNRPKS